MKKDGLWGIIYIITEWLTRLAVTNLLWLFFNIPIFIVALNFFVTDSTAQILFIGAMIMIMLPFFFFPSTTAMFALIRRWALNEVDAPLIRSFWKYYRENYVRSLLGGFIIVGIWAILLVDFFYFTTNVHDLLKYLFFALFIYMGMFTLHFFSNTVHFDTKLSQSLKNAFYMTLKNPISSLIVVILNIVIIVISVKILPFLLIFFTASLVAGLSFMAFHMISLHTKTA